VQVIVKKVNAIDYGALAGLKARIDVSLVIIIVEALTVSGLHRTRLMLSLGLCQVAESRALVVDMKIPIVDR
jgi:hypothetical protein